MHKIVNPQQTQLFDLFDSVLTEKTRKRLLDGWAGVFRHVILELMFGRTRLMGVAIKRFLTQLARHDLKVYELLDEQTEQVICCPAGHKPVSSIYDKHTGKTKTIMPTSTCSQCEFHNECPVEK